MPRKAATEVIADLKRQQEEIARKIREQEKEIKEKERKQHTTRLIAYGLLVMDELKTGERDEDEVRQKLDEILTQNSHRAALGLPLIGIAGKNKKSDGPAPDPALSTPPPANENSVDQVSKVRRKKPSTATKEKSANSPSPPPKTVLPVEDEAKIAAQFGK